jgi:hypothetical protein
MIAAWHGTFKYVEDRLPSVKGNTVPGQAETHCSLHPCAGKAAHPSQPCCAGNGPDRQSGVKCMPPQAVRHRAETGMPVSARLRIISLLQGLPVPLGIGFGNQIDVSFHKRRYRFTNGTAHITGHLDLAASSALNALGPQTR